MNTFDATMADAEESVSLVSNLREAIIFFLKNPFLRGLWRRGLIYVKRVIQNLGADRSF